MIELTEKPKNPIIIEGFPGFGFVSTIATEFLIKHLNAKKIGKFFVDDLIPLAVIHNSKLIDPLEIYYAKKENIIILRTLTNVSGAEWKVAGVVAELAEKLKAKEIISIEGIASAELITEGLETPSKVYYYTNQDERRFKRLNIEKLDEGIVMGVTGVLLFKVDKKIPMSCIFAEATPGLPDSRAAGEVIKVLDNYLGLKVDYKPLMKKAEEFEGKIKELIAKIKAASEKKEKKEVSYLG